MGLMKDYKQDYMTNEALQDLIGSWFPNPEANKSQPIVNLDTDEGSEESTKISEPINASLLEFSQEESQFLNITVQPEQLHSLMTRLKDGEQTQFDYLFCLTGVDWGADLGVVYHLESTIHRHILVLKVKTSDREHPVLDTVCNIWPTANFLEREVFDFFGITFNNHPNLKRLF